MKLVLKDNQVLNTESSNEENIVFDDNIKIGNNAMLVIVEELHSKTIDVVVDMLEFVGVPVNDSLKHDLYLRQKLIKSSPLYI